MYHSYDLLIGGMSYDITGCVKNWDDILTAIVRNDYDGIEQSFTSNFEFVGQAYSLIKSEYKKNRLQSNATVVFKLRNNSWLFNEKFRCRLDFSGYEDDGVVITIGGIDSSMKSIIRASGGTEYEIPVLDIRASGLLNSGQLSYDGLEIEQSAKWTVTGDSVDDTEEVSFVRPIKVTEGDLSIPSFAGSMYIKGSPEILFSNKLEVREGIENISEAFAPIGRVPGYFIIALRPVTVRVSIKLKFRSSINSYCVLQYDRNSGGSIAPVNAMSWTNTGSSNYTDVSFDGDIELTKDCAIRILFYASDTTKESTFYVKDQEVSATWNDRRTSPINIDLIAPSTLLTAILQKMTGSTDTRGLVDTSYDDRLYSSQGAKHTMLCAAESIRGIEDAKIYTSFNKFRDWMKSVFGYVYEISGNTVTFRHRRAYFDRATSVKTIKRYADYNYSINSGIIYSRVKAGFEQQDYEEVNGRDEFRFGTTYTTGVTLTNTELSLISPYRADAIGFEILATKRGKSTTDNSSDKNIFMVGTTFMPPKVINNFYNDGYYVLDRTISDKVISGLISPSTQFNLMFTPRRSLEANKEMVGACTNDLTFASSEGNSNVVIDGVSENGGVQIAESDRIFEVGIIQVTVPDIDIPDNVIGFIEIERNGETIRGFVDELEFAQGKRKETTFKLIEKADN